MIPTHVDNTHGLHQRFVLKKITGYKEIHSTDFGYKTITVPVTRPVPEDAEYFVLRLDGNGSDLEHLRACRIAINAYADAIEDHLPHLANDLRHNYPVL